MSDPDQPINVERVPAAVPGAVMKIMPENVPAVLAHRLAFWSKDMSGMLTLTFAEERAQLTEPGVQALHVCARVVVPVTALDGMIAFLESAKSPHAFAGTAPSSNAVN